VGGGGQRIFLLRKGGTELLWDFLQKVIYRRGGKRISLLGKGGTEDIFSNVQTMQVDMEEEGGGSKELLFLYTRWTTSNHVHPKWDWIGLKEIGFLIWAH